MSSYTANCTETLNGRSQHWWRALFVNHPGHARKDPEAFVNGGKIKVSCAGCLKAEVTFIEETADVRAIFLSPDRENQCDGPQVIYDNIILSHRIEWIACRKMNCLNHLKKCRNQPKDVHSAAKMELAKQNAIRREKRREKKQRNTSPDTPSNELSPVATATLQAPAPQLNPDNVIDRDPSSMLPDAHKVSYSEVASVLPEEALTVPYPANEAAVPFTDSTSSLLEDHPAAITPDGPFDPRLTPFASTTAAAESYIYPSVAWSNAGYSSSHCDAMPLGTFDGTYVRGVPIFDTGPDTRHKAIMPGWAPHVRQPSPMLPQVASQYAQGCADERDLVTLLTSMRVGENIQAYFEDSAPLPYLQEDAGLRYSDRIQFAAGCWSEYPGW